MSWPLYLKKNGECAECPDFYCDRCASISGRCLECTKGYTPSGTKCVADAACQKGKKGCAQCKNNK